MSGITKYTRRIYIIIAEKNIAEWHSAKYYTGSKIMRIMQSWVCLAQTPHNMKTCKCMHGCAGT